MQSSKAKSVSVDSNVTPSPLEAVPRLMRFLRQALSSHLQGEHADDLRDAQRDLILSRVVMLVWVGSVMMPLAIWLLTALTAPEALGSVVRFVAIGEIGALVIRALVKRGAFDKIPHLAMFLLVACVFGPVASATCVALQVYGTHFYFSYFLIVTAFVSLFPAELGWVLLTCLALDASYAVSLFFRSNAQFDSETITNLLYLIDMNVLAVMLNRIVSGLFFEERKTRLELREARDALLGEMAVAQEIQTLLLPKDASLPHHDLRGEMLPAEEVGGDYYDVVQTGSGRKFVAIGDVSGHGVTSGLTMMMARSILIGALEADPDASLEKLYSALNGGLRRNLERMSLRLFMTFILIEDMGQGRY